MTPGEQRVRLDKWLWAARFYKTRALAAEAVDMGRVSVNDERAKRSRLMSVGDRIAIRRPPFEQVVVVHSVAEQRGPASVAATLYSETEASVAARQRIASQMRALGHAGSGEWDSGRPTKKDRRELDRWRGRE